jgi:hypothetical protein
MSDKEHISKLHSHIYCNNPTHKELKEGYGSLYEDHEKLKQQMKEVKDFLWAMGNQREKAVSHLITLVRKLYPYYSPEDQNIIYAKILKGLK